jgi:hypothetical protein
MSLAGQPPVEKLKLPARAFGLPRLFETLLCPHLLPTAATTLTHTHCARVALAVQLLKVPAPASTEPQLEPISPTPALCSSTPAHPHLHTRTCTPIHHHPFHACLHARQPPSVTTHSDDGIQQSSTAHTQPRVPSTRGRCGVQLHLATLLENEKPRPSQLRPVKVCWLRNPPPQR